MSDQIKALCTAPGATSRFVKAAGGAIMDTATGLHVAAVDVNSLDTENADRVSNAIIAALHREFGPDRALKAVTE